ncbi:MAG TPA: M55 family metallopeptidase [Candidatus Micrarchaeia archaeon]|nr:M55 family metallopeptidase [Candidatus Micrarchaeia archaeon]
MRVLVAVDMEGIAGITSATEVMPGTSEYGRLRALMTAEANAAVAGAFDAGAAQVTVTDAHDRMRNLLYEQLDDRAHLVSGPVRPLDMVQGAADADCAVFLGFHSPAGTPRSTLAHTLSVTVRRLELDGVVMGETELGAAVCASFGVPVALVTGDDALARHLSRSMPATPTLVVKESLAYATARARPRAEVLESIRAATRAAVAAPPPPPPPPPTPVRVSLEFLHPALIEMVAMIPTVAAEDPATVTFTAPDVVRAVQVVSLCTLVAEESMHAANLW